MICPLLESTPQALKRFVGEEQLLVPPYRPRLRRRKKLNTLPVIKLRPRAHQPEFQLGANLELPAMKLQVKLSSSLESLIGYEVGPVSVRTKLHMPSFGYGTNLKLPAMKLEAKQRNPSFDIGIENDLPSIKVRVRQHSIESSAAIASNLPPIRVPLVYPQHVFSAGIASTTPLYKLNLTLPQHEFVASFGMTVRRNAYNIKLHSPEVIYGTNLAPPNVKVPLTSPQPEVTIGVNTGLIPLVLGLSTGKKINMYVAGTALSQFMEASRSSAGIVVYGTEGQFKFNKTAGNQKRLGRSHIVHTGPAKPSIVTVVASFTLLSNTQNLETGEFRYVSEDGILVLVNADDVDTALTLDPSDTTAIPIVGTQLQSGDYVLIDLHSPNE